MADQDAEIEELATNPLSAPEKVLELLGLARPDHMTGGDVGGHQRTPCSLRLCQKVWRSGRDSAPGHSTSPPEGYWLILD